MQTLDRAGPIHPNTTEPFTAVPVCLKVCIKQPSGVCVLSEQWKLFTSELLWLHMVTSSPSQTTSSLSKMTALSIDFRYARWDCWSIYQLHTTRGQSSPLKLKLGQMQGCDNVPFHQQFQIPSVLCVMNIFPSDSILLAIKLLGTRKHRLR